MSPQFSPSLNKALASTKAVSFTLQAAALSDEADTAR